MKKLIYIISLVVFVMGNKIYSEDSFKFLERYVIFGITSERFIETYSEFIISSELSTEARKNAIYIIPVNGGEIQFTITFANNSLTIFEMKVTGSQTDTEIRITDEILSQFKITFAPPDDEYGDGGEEYKKGNLIATIFNGSFFMLSIEPFK